MNAPIRSKVFQTKRGLEVRFPASLGFAPDTEVELVKIGSEVVIRRVKEPAACRDRDEA